VDFFIAPAQFLMDRFLAWGIPPEKMTYMDYGFDAAPFENRIKTPSEKVRFGFIGRIIPAKGVDHLIEATNGLDPARAEVNIFGAHNGDVQYLQRLIAHVNVAFKGGFDNAEIADKFSEIDVLVVPSRWYENSPLVIHEAFLAGVPVITADMGGMAELVQDGVNGLLFRAGDPQDLRAKMQIFVDDPSLISRLGHANTPVRTIERDATEIRAIYADLIQQKRSAG
jgi:glycosyltransferase involved in cell wall biosynthesis